MIAMATFFQNYPNTEHDWVVYFETHGILGWIFIGSAGRVARRENRARARVWMYHGYYSRAGGSGAGWLDIYAPGDCYVWVLGEFGGGYGGRGFAGGCGEVVCGWEVRSKGGGLRCV